ncbi:HAD family hydrolase [Nocardioides sp.]|uniref:HAD family hydrolase n=1 Tax=Nocardioides sp. TaxID=35761 RepID=UPI0039E3EE52
MKWPRWFAPLVVLVAAVAFLTHGLLDDGKAAAYVGAAVLLAGAPGALASAFLAPLRLGRRRGAALGIRFLQRSAVDAATEVDTLLLDGLDTLVDGRHVASIDPLDESHLRNLRWFAGALEHTSDHPIGRAIARLSARGNVTGVEHHPGLGISGSVDRHPVRVGEPAWIGVPATSDGPGVVVAVEVDARLLGTITVVDSVRSDAADAAATLHALGVRPVLVSSAPGARARSVADQVGIAEAIDGDLADGAGQRGSGVAALTTGPLVSTCALTIGPASPQVATDDCGIATGAAALRLCHDMAATTRLAARTALGFHLVLMALAATGLFPLWVVALCAAAGVGLVWLLVLYALRRGRRNPRFHQPRGTSGDGRADLSDLPGQRPAPSSRVSGLPQARRSGAATPLDPGGQRR